MKLKEFGPGGIPHAPLGSATAYASLTRVLFKLPIIFTCVTAVGWWAGNTWLNFVRPGSNPVRARAGLLRQPDSLQ